MHRVLDTNPPDPTNQQEKMRMRAAAFKATRLYPGPAGQLLSREILSWEEFGYRLGSSGLMMRLIDEILKAPTASETDVRMYRSAVGYGE